MGAETNIEWTDATWNPIGGCSIHSPGCINCYAQKLAGTRLAAHPLYAGTTKAVKGKPVFNGTLTVAANESPVWRWPLSWRGSKSPVMGTGQRSLIFVGDMSDLFHEDRPDAVIDRVFAVMALCPQHTFQVLTKRADRMRDYCSTIQKNGRWLAMEDIALQFGYEPRGENDHGFDWISNKQFLPNVWLGVSVEDQERADERIPLLLDTPAAVRFISAEPLLGPITLSGFVPDTYSAACDAIGVVAPSLDWIICGGESGPAARPMHPEWARSLRDQCAAAGVPFFFKQWGEWAPDEGPLANGTDPIMDGRARCAWLDRTEWRFEESDYDVPLDASKDSGQWLYRLGKGRAGRLLDGVEWNEFPKMAA